ncbi:uncharacterized protein LOC102385453 isoform X1 [Alligator sinensis]|uniref:Uncharacterized protein LOC102385453 isoform X1 n=2 Tax=Alligator sinensis TaxID=38654 RepID=A0A1U8DMA3_ALLSI|nr:uncharacterized protein LOC102385453 isoform X1 [Alligator sinensis]
MDIYSILFFLLSILMTGCCQTGGNEFQESQKLRQNLIIAAMSVFLVMSLLLILGCSFIHYKLVTKDDTAVKEEVKSVAIKTHSHRIETRIVLSPSQVMQLAASQQQMMPVYKHSGHVLPRPGSNQSGVSFKYIDCGIAPSAPRSHTPESFLSTLSKSGSPYSLDQHNFFDMFSRSSSRESTDIFGYRHEDGEGSSDSGTTVYCPIHSNGTADLGSLNKY